MAHGWSTSASRGSWMLIEIVEVQRLRQIQWPKVLLFSTNFVKKKTRAEKHELKIMNEKNQEEFWGFYLAVWPSVQKLWTLIPIRLANKLSGRFCFARQFQAFGRVFHQKIPAWQLFWSKAAEESPRVHQQEAFRFLHWSHGGVVPSLKLT